MALELKFNARLTDSQDPHTHTHTHTHIMPMTMLHVPANLPHWNMQVKEWTVYKFQHFDRAIKTKFRTVL
jgi:hypothetical protein